MTILKRLFCLVLGVVIVTILPVGLWLAAASGALRDANTYKTGLASQNIYEDVVPVALPAAAEISQEENSTQVILLNINAIRDTIGEDAWRDIANTLVPPDWLQTQTENAIDLIFSQINAQPVDETQTVVDIQGLQERLTGEQGQTSINRIIASAPACSQSEITQLESYDFASGLTMPICRPPENQTVLMRDLLTAQFSRLSEHLDQVQLELDDLTELSSQEIDDAHHFWDAYKQIIAVLYLGSTTLMALTVTLVVRTFRGFGRWIGITLVLVGIVAVVPLPLLRIGISEAITNILTDTTIHEAEMRVFEARLTQGLLLSLFHEFSGPVTVQAMALAALGGALILASMLSGRRTNTVIIIQPDGQVVSVKSGQVIGTVTSTENQPSSNS